MISPQNRDVALLRNHSPILLPQHFILRSHHKMNASSIPKTPQQDSSFKSGLFQSIRHKLLFAFMAIIALLAISIASLSYYSARNALRAEAFSGLEALRETRSEQLLLWLQDRQQEAKLLAANPTVVIAANSLINSLEQPMNPQTTPAHRQTAAPPRRAMRSQRPTPPRPTRRPRPGRCA